MSITPTLDDSDENFPYGLNSNTPIYEYQDADTYSAVVVREAQLLQSQQHRSEYIIFTNLDLERFSRDFQDPTDWTAFESYYPRSQILMAKLDMDAHANAKEKFNLALIDKLSAM